VGERGRRRARRAPSARLPLQANGYAIDLAGNPASCCSIWKCEVTASSARQVNRNRVGSRSPWSCSRRGEETRSRAHVRPGRLPTSSSRDLSRAHRSRSKLARRPSGPSSTKHRRSRSRAHECSEDPHLEDSRPDADLVEAALAAGGARRLMSWRVDRREGVRRRHSNPAVRLILGRLHLPAFARVRAGAARSPIPRCPSFLPGSIGEELAVERLKEARPITSGRIGWRGCPRGAACASMKRRAGRTPACGSTVPASTRTSTALASGRGVRARQPGARTPRASS